MTCKTKNVIWKNRTEGYFLPPKEMEITVEKILEIIARIGEENKHEDRCFYLALDMVKNEIKRFKEGK
jgi:hypothetical protein